MSSIRPSSRIGQLYGCHAGTGIPHDALGSSHAHAEAIGKGFQGGIRQRSDNPFAPDARHLATCVGRGLLAIGRTMRTQSHGSDQGLDEQQQNEVMQIRDIIIQTVADKRSTTKEEIVQALAEKDIYMDEHRLSYHIRMAEISGTICSGDLLPMKATYALTADKVKSKRIMDRDETLLLLTRKYIQSRQPATLEDFVWWSGLNISDCRKGITLMGQSIHSEKWKGRDFYLTDTCRTRGFSKGKYLLIAPYDEYLISYKSRDIVLSPEYKHKAHNNSGIFQPVIAHDGIICGNWAPFKQDNKSDFFLGKHEDGILSEWSRYKKYQMK